MPGRPLSVLLLEDDPYDASLITERLEMAGFELALRRVVSEESFSSALHEPWDVIISDYNVPGYDGREALRAVRATSPEVPVIFVTGAIGEDRAIELLQQGATDYVLKDRPDRLVSCVERALREVKQRADKLRAEEDLRQRAEFEQHLLAIVSHDLRNPLHVIQLATEIVLERTELAPDLVRALARIKGASERANAMISDLLDFSRARAGTIRLATRPTDLHELVARYAEETEVTHAGRHVAVNARGNTQGDWDPDRLGQVVSNLLSNAIRYSPASSTIGVAIAGEHDSVVLEVHNEGEPIPAELRRRLFRPLSRGDAHVNHAVRSVGLGLYIVDHIIRAHHGVIRVTSDAGTGTTFRVELPRLHRAPHEVP